MIGKTALTPYEGYRVYKVYHSKEKRYFAVLVSTSNRTTIQWAKYVLETTLGRKITPGYVVHHRDGNSVNDDISNLEEKLSSLHRRDHNSSPIQHGKPGGYRRGCRCLDCRKANYISQSKWANKKNVLPVAA